MLKWIHWPLPSEVKAGVVYNDGFVGTYTGGGSGTVFIRRR